MCVCVCVCTQASGGGDGGVRLWHVRPAVTSVSSVSSSYIDTAPPYTQVHVHSGTRALRYTCTLTSVGWVARRWPIYAAATALLLYS